MILSKLCIDTVVAFVHRLAEQSANDTNVFWLCTQLPNRICIVVWIWIRDVQFALYSFMRSCGECELASSDCDVIIATGHRTFMLESASVSFLNLSVRNVGTVTWQSSQQLTFQLCFC